MDRIDQKRETLKQVFRSAAESGWAEQILVRSVMTPQPFCVSSQHTANELVELFHSNRFRHFLVADDSKLVGVISDRDVIRLFGTTQSLEPEYLQTVSVSELMSTDLITISPDATLGTAAAMMLQHGINCLPVVKDGQAIGILTSTDIFLSLEQVLRALHPEAAAV